MSDTPAGRRRRRRRTRRGDEGAKTTYQPRETPAPRPKAPTRELPEWNWRTFPVFFAFIVGVVLMGLAIAVPVLGLIFFIGGLVGLAFGVAHILTRLWVTRRHS